MYKTANVWQSKPRTTEKKSYIRTIRIKDIRKYDEEPTILGQDNLKTKYQKVLLDFS
jgi:hypothetical protein